MRRVVGMVLGVLIVLGTMAEASEYDNFFKQEDKQAHMIVSVMTGAICNLLAAKAGASKREAFWVGLGGALVIGLGKELYDEHKYGGFSTADMLANGIGGTIGTGSITLLRFNSGEW